ncbi:peptidoglycan recognition protein [Kitasatospora sp. NPDC050543]|uniref:peptidoglycan recognition protein n=1 Tax=Kitasatospora sp. NPDC050543 TaxID=3364054 RepID=UPI003798E828
MDIDRRLVLRRVVQAASAAAVVALPAAGGPRRVLASGDRAPAAPIAPALTSIRKLPAPPPIMPCTLWQTNPAPPEVQYDRAVRAVFIHHTENGNTYRAQAVPDIIRAIQRDHRENRGWDDIGYNFLVDRFGTVYEGRRGGVDRPVVGAHTIGFNRETVGVAAIGTYSAGAQVPEPVVEAIARLAAWKLAADGTDPRAQCDLTSTSSESRFPVSTHHAFNAVSGHRDAFCTLCPGDALYALIPRIIERAAQLQLDAELRAPGPPTRFG